MSKISDNLRLIRIIRGYSVRQIAQMVGRSPGTISNWESGKISPDVDTFAKLCNIYNISPNELIGWVDCDEIMEFIESQSKMLNEIERLKAERTEIDNKIKSYIELLGPQNY